MASPDDAALYEDVMQDCDALLDCQPGKLAPDMARLCLTYEMHYVNLTEYVRETAEITEMASEANTGFILQTGLAPGYVNNLAIHLVDTFRQKYGVEKLERLSMRVGALTQYTEWNTSKNLKWCVIMRSFVCLLYLKKKRSLSMDAGTRLISPAAGQQTCHMR
jgi:saccharopine dehydrogenase-like NADP-dependent oxidoreductase